MIRPLLHLKISNVFLLMLNNLQIGPRQALISIYLFNIYSLISLCTVYCAKLLLKLKFKNRSSVYAVSFPIVLGQFLSLNTSLLILVINPIGKYERDCL